MIGGPWDGRCESEQATLADTFVASISASSDGAWNMDVYSRRHGTVGGRVYDYSMRHGKAEAPRGICPEVQMLRAILET